MANLLISVRSVAEAEAALKGGAGLIDIKEPLRGPLGRADHETIAAIIRRVGGMLPVSAAMGELLEDPGPFSGHGLTYLKWGLAGYPAGSEWQRDLLGVARRLRALTIAGTLVPVAYADWRRA